MISLKSVSKEYDTGVAKTVALNEISLEIKHGEFVSIMGPSGSGKSTLLHILSFLDRPNKGEYLFSGKNTNDLSDKDLARLRNKEIGFVFQSFNLLSRSSVYENVEMPLLYSNHVEKKKRRHKVEDAIEAVGLNEKTGVETAKLSGGQKQRVAIARALINDPNIIFADEPTGNLDSKSGEKIMEILQQLNKNGKTIVLVTHETYTAEFGRRLIHLKDGFIESDSPIQKRDGVKDKFFK